MVEICKLSWIQAHINSFIDIQLLHRLTITISKKNQDPLKQTHTQTYGDNCLGLKMLPTKKKYKFLEINSFGPNVGLIFSSEATL